MATLANAPAHWFEGATTQKHKSDVNIYSRLMASADINARNMTPLFTISLIVQCVLFLPLVLVLMFYYNTPVSILAITLTLFFANIIKCIGGSGHRSIISIFAVVLIDLIMLVLFFV